MSQAHLSIPPATSTPPFLLLLLVVPLLQFLLELQGDQNIAAALTQFVASSLHKEASSWEHQRQQHQAQQELLLHLLAGQQQQLCWHTMLRTLTEAQLFSLVLVLTQQLATAQQQHAASLQAQEQLQQDVLQLKRSLASAQQRKQAAEVKLRTAQHEGRALAVALKTMANMLVDQSEEKAGLQCNADQMVVVQQQQQGVKRHALAAAAVQQQQQHLLLLTHDQHPTTPSGSFGGDSRAAVQQQQQQSQHEGESPLSVSALQSICEEPVSWQQQVRGGYSYSLCAFYIAPQRCCRHGSLITEVVQT